MLHRRELSWSRCVELLRSRGVCRIAVASPDGPLIYPANYSLLDDAVWFRLSAQSALAAQIGPRAVVALQVDRLDEENPSGWTVQVRGQAVTVSDSAMLEQARAAWSPRPWSLPGRFVYLRLSLDDVSGREIERPTNGETGPGQP